MGTYRFTFKMFTLSTRASLRSRNANSKTCPNLNQLLNAAALPAQILNAAALPAAKRMSLRGNATAAKTNLKTPFISPSGSRETRESLGDDSFVGLTGGEIFHEMMLRHDVKVVFGYPGGAILPVYDAIYNSEYFDFVLPRHEQGAGHMAEGYVFLFLPCLGSSISTAPNPIFKAFIIEKQ